MRSVTMFTYRYSCSLIHPECLRRSCIEKWIKTKKTCPQCNAKARQADIRVLFTPTIAASELGQSDLAEERAAEAEKKSVALEIKIRQLEKSNDDLVNECRRLKEESADKE
jgi:hypothetical protein